MYHDFAKSKNKKIRTFQLCLLFSVILFATNPLLAIDSLQVHWSTYIGGSEGFWGSNDNVCEMVTDDIGNLYLVGDTRTSNLPNRTNEHPSNNTCAFAAKLNDAGTILWSTYIGGSYSPGNDGGFGIMIDPIGEYVYITGKSQENDIPGVISPGWGHGAFVTKIRTSDGNVQWSRFLTKNYSNETQGNALCMHGSYLYVTGSSPNNELLGADNDFAGGGCDAFISKLSTDGTVVKSVWYGGFESDYGSDIFLDAQGNIYVAGNLFWYYIGGVTNPDYNLPNEKNEWRGDQKDGFACKLNSALEVQWSRYIGGINHDWAYGIIGDNQENLWITGGTKSDDLEGEIIGSFNGYGDPLTTDGYITRVNTDGNTIKWTSFAGYYGGVVLKPKLTSCRKIITISKTSPNNHALQMFDADLGNHQWLIHESTFLNCSGNSFKDIFIDEDMNIYICGDAPYFNTNFPNLNNDHSNKGFDGFFVKTSPKGEFFNFQDDLMSPWVPISTECWSVQNGKLVFKGINQHIFRLVLLNEVFYNFTLQVQVQKTSGSTSSTYGVFIRRDPETKDAYQFGINSNGEYFVNYWKDGNSQRIIDFTLSDAIKPGLNVCNTLKVIAKDSVLSFYVNGVALDTLKSVAIMGGAQGLFGEDNQNVTNIIEFDNVYIGSYTTTPTGVEEAEIASSLPQEFGLAQNYPNPFNPTTTIKYTIPKESKVTLRIYNLLGEEVITLVDIVQQGGTYTVHWNGMTEDGTWCPSGLYIYKMKAGDFVDTKKVMLIR